MSKILSGVASPVERDIYIDQLARKYQISRESLKMEIDAQKGQGKAIEKPPVIHAHTEGAITASINQRTLMRLALVDKKTFDNLANEKIYWEHTGYERAFEDLKSRNQLTFPIDIGWASRQFVEKNYLSKEEAYALERVGVNATMNDLVVQKSLHNLKINYLKKRRQELIQDIDDAEAEGKANIDELIEEFNQINEQITY